MKENKIYVEYKNKPNLKKINSQLSIQIKDVKTNKSRSLTLYNISLADCYNKLIGFFEGGEEKC